MVRHSCTGKQRKGILCIEQAEVGVSKAYSEYIKSHHLPNRMTDQQAVQVLARMYPCSGGQDLANTEIAKSIGNQIEVVPTGEYASINMKPMITILQKLQTTSGHENDALRRHRAECRQLRAARADGPGSYPFPTRQNRRCDILV
jgi:hypothetical protein